MSRAGEITIGSNVKCAGGGGVVIGFYRMNGVSMICVRPSTAGGEWRYAQGLHPPKYVSLVN